LSIVGNYVRTFAAEALHRWNQEAQAVVNQYSGTYPNPQAVHNLFSQPGKTDRSGCCPADGVECRYDSRDAAHPSSPGFESAPNWYRCSESQGGANPVLNALDDRDGDVDIADAMQMAGRYLSR